MSCLPAGHMDSTNQCIQELLSAVSTHGPGEPEGRRSAVNMKVKERVRVCNFLLCGETEGSVTQAQQSCGEFRTTTLN